MPMRAGRWVPFPFPMPIVPLGFLLAFVAERAGWLAEFATQILLAGLAVGAALLVVALAAGLRRRRSQSTLAEIRLDEARTRVQTKIDQLTDAILVFDTATAGASVHYTEDGFAKATTIYSSALNRLETLDTIEELTTLEAELDEAITSM